MAPATDSDSSFCKQHLFVRRRHLVLAGHLPREMRPATAPGVRNGKGAGDGRVFAGVSLVAGGPGRSAPREIDYVDPDAHLSVADAITTKTQRQIPTVCSALVSGRAEFRLSPIRPLSLWERGWRGSR